MSFNFMEQPMSFAAAPKLFVNKKTTIDTDKVEEYLKKVEKTEEVLDNWAAEQARKTKIEYWPGDPVQTKIKTFTCKGCGAPAKEDSKCDYCGNINYKE